MLENTTKKSVGVVITPLATKLTSFLGRHEGYYVSKVNQTVLIPPAEPVEFLAEELVNVEYSHKVYLSLRVAPHP